MREELLRLAQRCEAATGPGRELDRAIFAQPVHSVSALDLGARNQSLAIPAYTASLDAALTLVPEGWHVGQYVQGPSGRPYIWLLRTIRAEDQRYTECEGRSSVSAALALCATALRARASSHASGEGQ